MKWLDTYLAEMYLDEVTRDVIDRLTYARSKLVSHASTNRMLAVLRAILRKAHREWNWLDSLPAVRMLPAPKRRVRWLTRKEATRLLEELREHLAEMARFSLVTGLRQGNGKGLEWSQVDFERSVAWVHGDQTKNRRALPVPLNADAKVVLRRQTSKHATRVFTYAGQPIQQVGTKAWRAALKRAGIEDFRWHDLRHTWASWHVQAGTPLHVLQELSGWASADMVRRYAHLSADHLAEYVARLSDLPVVENPRHILVTA